jgi:hypothetical protein
MGLTVIPTFRSIGIARTALRSELIPQAPKAGILLRVFQKIDSDRYIDYSDVKPSAQAPRVSYVEKRKKIRLVKSQDTTDKHYPLKVFENTWAWWADVT